MTEPKRLSHGGDLGASLLASARGDGPRAGSRARTAAAIGLGLGVGAAIGSAATVASATAAKAAGASIAPKAIGAGAGAGAKVATALWLKLLAAGVVTVAVAGAVAVKVERSSHHAEATLADRGQAPVPVSGPREAPAPQAARTIAPPEVPTAAAPPEVPTAAAAPVALARAAPHPLSTAASPPPESPLAQELRSLDEARSALGRGDPSGALVQLERHDRAFPAGPLRTEARVLRAEALLARGDRAAAQKLAVDLLARDPAGPHARRLRTIAEGAP